ERDVENMQSPNLVNYTPRVSQSGGRTTRFTFHTLADPALGEASPIVAVTYRLENTYSTMEAGGATHDVYRVARYVNDGTGYTYAGGSAEGVFDFDVALLSRDGTQIVTNGSAPAELGRVRVHFQKAVEGIAQLASDQASTSRSNMTQQGYTFRPPALSVAEDTELPAGTIVPSAEAELPASPYPPPPGEGGGSGGSGGGSGGSGGGSGGSGGGSGGGSTPPPPPPPPPDPPPPPGMEL